MRMVICSTPVDDARTLATALVDARLAACVSIVPAVQSVYRWEGEVAQAEEALLLIKTTAARMPELTARILALHPYDVPEIIAFDIRDNEGNAAYLSWLAQSVAP
ncbi:MAG: divalent-cation tolerance protein CutA [Proteobacteria bacterium]|nr:divalent-cation tolerance protein CutA [Pseudomonadota bacterium]